MINRTNESLWAFKMACVKCCVVFTYNASDVIQCPNTNIQYIPCPSCYKSLIPYHMPECVIRGRLP